MADAFFTRLAATATIATHLKNQASFDAISRSERVALVGLLEATPMEVGDVAKALEAVTNIGLLREDHQAVLDVLTRKLHAQPPAAMPPPNPLGASRRGASSDPMTVPAEVHAPAVAPAPLAGGLRGGASPMHPKQQDFTSVIHFLTDHAWRQFKNGTATLALHTCAVLGMRSATEATFRDLGVCVLMCSEGVERTTDMDPKMRTAYGQTIKQEFRKVKMMYEQPQVWILKLEDAPSELQAARPAVYEAVYHSAPPTDFPFSKVLYEHLRHGTGCRRNRNGELISAFLGTMQNRGQDKLADALRGFKDLRGTPRRCIPRATTVLALEDAADGGSARCSHVDRRSEVVPKARPLALDDTPTPWPEAPAETDGGEVTVLKAPTKKPRMSVADVTSSILDAIAPGKKKPNDGDDASEPDVGKKDDKRGKGKGKGKKAQAKGKAKHNDGIPKVRYEDVENRYACYYNKMNVRSFAYTKGKGSKAKAERDAKDDLVSKTRHQRIKVFKIILLVIMS